MRKPSRTFIRFRKYDPRRPVIRLTKSYLSFSFQDDADYTARSVTSCLMLTYVPRSTDTSEPVKPTASMATVDGTATGEATVDGSDGEKGASECNI